MDALLQQDMFQDKLHKAISVIAPTQEYLAKIAGGPEWSEPLQPSPLPTPHPTPLPTPLATPMQSPPGTACGRRRASLPKLRRLSETTVTRRRTTRFSAKQAARLRLVCRSLSEILAINQAARNERDVVSTVLRQHEEALVAREMADALCEREAQCAQSVRKSITELERSLRSAHLHNGEVESIASRVQMLEHRCADAQLARDTLQNDLDKLTQALTEATAKNFGSQASIKQIEVRHSECLAENARAQQILGPLQSFESWKTKKEFERSSAEENLARAKASSEAQIRKLSDTIVNAKAKCQSDLSAMQKEVQQLEDQLEERRVETRSALEKQAADQQRVLDEQQRWAISEKKLLDELVQQRAASLQKEADVATKRLEEMAKTAEKNLNSQRKELSETFQARAKAAQAASASVVEQERQAIEKARQRADQWRKHAANIREKHQMTAMTRGKYILGDSSP